MASNAKHGGARPNSGPPTKAETMGLKAMLDKAFPSASREKVWKNLIDNALSDDPKISQPAMGLLLAYTYGKPTEKKELSGADGGALEIVVRYADD